MWIKARLRPTLSRLFRCRSGRKVEEHSDSEFDLHLSRDGYLFWSFICGSIMAWASYVILEYFHLALSASEEDGASRNLTLATAGLFVIAGVLAFLLPALLPKRRMRSMRIGLILFGCVLVGFEVTTLYGAQQTVALAQQAKAQAANAKRELLEQSLARADQIAAAATATAARQGASKFAESRADGSDLVRRLLESEVANRSTIDQVAELQATEKPPLTHAYGEKGAQRWFLVRSILLSVINLLMGAACGAFIRAARGMPKTGKVDAFLEAVFSQPRRRASVPPALPFSLQSVPVVVPATAWQGKVRALEYRGFVPGRDTVRAGSRNSTVAGATLLTGAQQEAQRAAQQRAWRAQDALVHSEVDLAVHGQSERNSEGLDERRYVEVRAAVLHEMVGHSVRDIKEAFQCCNERSRGYQARMIAESILVPAGRGATAGYKLNPDKAFLTTLRQQISPPSSFYPARKQVASLQAPIRASA